MLVYELITSIPVFPLPPLSYSKYCNKINDITNKINTTLLIILCYFKVIYLQKPYTVSHVFRYQRFVTTQNYLHNMVQLRVLRNYYIFVRNFAFYLVFQNFFKIFIYHPRQLTLCIIHSKNLTLITIYIIILLLFNEKMGFTYNKVVQCFPSKKNIENQRIYYLKELIDRLSQADRLVLFYDSATISKRRV